MWYVWQAVSSRYEFHDATGSLMPFGIAYDIDSKAMRKAVENQTIVMMYESQSGAVNVTAHIRTLVKLA